MTFFQGGLLLALLAPLSGHAMPMQQERPAGPDSVATITTDTGVFAPGHTTFAHYDVPGLCRAAAEYTREVLRRSALAQEIMDTIRITMPARDTLPSGAVAVARTCGGHFTVAGTAPRDLEDLFHLALLEQNDSLAAAVVQRRMALAVTPAARDAILESAVSVYLAAEPARVVAVTSLLAQIEARGTKALGTQLAVHDSLLALYSRVFDVTRMREEADTILALSRAGSLEAINYDVGSVMTAYGALMSIAFVQHPDSMEQIATRAKADLSRFPPPSQLPPGRFYRLIKIPDFKKASVQRIMTMLSPIFGEERQQTLGRTLPALQATYWFGKDEHHDLHHDRPLSLFVYGRGGVCLGGLDSPAFYASCTGLTPRERMKIAQYAARGVAVTVSVQTWTSALGDLPASPAEKADTISWYYRTHLHLPVTVAVTVDSVARLPAPDGRIFPCIAGSRTLCADTSDNAKRYMNGGAPLVLVGRDGKVQYVGNFSPLADALIAKLLSKSRTTTTTALGGTDVSR